MNVLGIAFVGFLVYFFIVVIYNAKSSEKKAAEDEMYKAEQKALNACDSPSFKKSFEQLQSFQSSYDENKDLLSDLSRSCYEDTIETLRDHCFEVIHDQWEAKAHKILDEFCSLYALIAESDFDDVDLAYRSRDKCMKKYDAYWDWTRNCTEHLKEAENPRQLWADARSAMKSALLYDLEIQDLTIGETYFSEGNLSVREQIDRRLKDYVDKMRPEYKRKMLLYDIMVYYVLQCQSIRRSVLLKTDFPGYVADEVKCCYRSLIQERRLVEIKMGGSYFVSLSDKEAAKEHKLPRYDFSVIRQLDRTKGQREAEQKGALSSPSDTDKALPPTDYTENEFMQFLSQNHLRHVNKRDVGGYLWIEDRDGNQELFSSITVDGHRIHYAKSTRNFNGSPGWYVDNKKLPA